MQQGTAPLLYSAVDVMIDSVSSKRQATVQICRKVVHTAAKEQTAAMHTFADSHCCNDLTSTVMRMVRCFIRALIIYNWISVDFGSFWVCCAALALVYIY